MTENEVEVTIFYETWDGGIINHKTMRPKRDVTSFADGIITHGFRRLDEGGYIHQIPPNMIREIIWSDCD